MSLTRRHVTVVSRGSWRLSSAMPRNTQASCRFVMLSRGSDHCGQSLGWFIKQSPEEFTRSGIHSEMLYRYRQTMRLGLRFISAMRGEQKYETLHYISRVGDVFSRTQSRQCPICGYKGFFLSHGLQNRPE